MKFHLNLIDSARFVKWIVAFDSSLDIVSMDQYNEARFQEERMKGLKVANP